MLVAVVGRTLAWGKMGNGDGKLVETVDGSGLHPEQLGSLGNYPNFRDTYPNITSPMNEIQGKSSGCAVTE